MNRWKEVLAVACALTVFFSFAGCSAPQASPAPTQTPQGQPPAAPSEAPQMEGQGSGKLTDTSVTITFARPESPLQPFKEDCVSVQEIEKRTGIHLEVMVIPESDYANKMNTLMATNQLPDIFSMWGSDPKDIISTGALLDMKELIASHAPIIHKDQDTIPNLKRTEVNGGIYTLPQLRRDENFEQGSTPNIRIDLLEEQNIPVPTTWDELYDALVKLKSAYPDHIVWGCRGENNLLRNNLSPIKSLGGDYGLYMDESGTWKLGRMEAGYKNALTFLNKLYTEGILDNEYLITSSDDWKSGLASGKYLFYYDNPVFLESFNTTLAQTNPNARFAPIPFLKNSEGITQNYSHPDNYFNAWGVSADTKNPELVIKLLNWMYSEEGGLLMNYGVEGTHYDMVEGVPTFKKELVDEYMKRTGDPSYEVSSDLGIGDLFFAPAWYSNYADAFKIAGGSSLTRAKIHETYADRPEAILQQPAQPPYTIEEAEQIKIINQNIEDYSVTEVNKFVTGERSLDEYDQFVQELKSMGADDLIKIVNNAEARFQQGEH